VSASGLTVLVAGAHGKIGQRLVRRLADEGHRPRGLVRKPEQAARIEELGGEPVVADLEVDFDPATVDGADAIVFTAGAGPGSGDARKETMDYGGAAKLVDAAEARGVPRFVIVSSMGAGDPEAAPEAMRPYQRAKGKADERVRASGLDWTVVRPGGLTDDPGRGTVDVAPELRRRGQVSRDDVAEVIVVVLAEPATVGKTFELLEGDTPIREALRRL
jgi:nucleoside-diphosphate-sugar epimerase